jgi:hypothetical protein
MTNIFCGRPRSSYTDSTRPVSSFALTVASALACVLIAPGAVAVEQNAENTDSYSMSSDGADDAPPEASSDGWEYDDYYIFPLTRNMSDSGLPQAGQIALYPLAFLIDLAQWPVGALAGLAGK